MKAIESAKQKYGKSKKEVYSLLDYLEKAKTDASMYASPAERMLKAIGEPVLVETINDPKLSMKYGNKIIKTYPTFKDFYGMEEVIEEIVNYFTASAQGLEERKQILYLLGPVGSAKSSLAETLKRLMEKEPIYALADKEGRLSPILDNPLGLFGPEDAADLGIPARYLTEIVSPWAIKRLKEYEGDVTQFKVVKLYPNRLDQLAITKTEPGDENNQDISALVGKVNIRELENFNQDDPDAYSFSGGLCKANRGLLEFVEMFKAPIKLLHPLLTATQEQNYNATESLSSIPFDGIILAHSNQSEWSKFRANKDNEAFIDRVCIVRVAYPLAVDDVVGINRKLLGLSDLVNHPIAPGTLEMLSQFEVLTRLEPVEGADIYTKLRVYNGEDVKVKDVHAKPYHEYKELASNQEGMEGISTRDGFKILSQVFNHDAKEVSADPVHLLIHIDNWITNPTRNHSKEQQQLYGNFLDTYLKKELSDMLQKHIEMSFLDGADEYGQNIFDRYVDLADHWVADREYRDADTGEMMDRSKIDAELQQLEKPAGIANPKDFRNDVVAFCLRYQAKNNGRNPKWSSYQKLKTVLEKTMFKSLDDMLPVIKFQAKSSKEDMSKHQDFVKKMMELGYTEVQVKRLVDWQIRYKKSV